MTNEQAKQIAGEQGMSLAAYEPTHPISGNQMSGVVVFQEPDGAEHDFHFAQSASQWPDPWSTSK